MKTKILWALRIIAAVILLQTLYFKFSGADESKYIFSTLHAEPWGRWFSGVCELIASVLLLISATQVLGAFLALGIMSGAIVSHLFILGLVVQDDGGLLFSLAVLVWICSALILFFRQDQVLTWISRLKGVQHGH